MPAPTVTKTPRAKQALAAMFGVNAPTYAVTTSRLPWGTQLRRWALRKAARMVWRATRKMWGWKRPLAPLYLAMVAWLAAALASMVERGWVTILFLGLLGAIPLYRWLGLPAWRFTKRRDVKPTEQRIWYAGFYASIMLWSTLAAATTVAPPMPGILGVVAVSAWIRWMWHHRTRPPMPVTIPEAVTGPQATWADLAVGGGVLPGSTLEAVSVGDGKWDATIRLAPGGRQTTWSAIAAIPSIASAYGLPLTSVIVEPTAGGEANLAKLTTYTRNPLHAVQTFEKPSLDPATGQFNVGVHHDGTDAKWRLFVPGWGSCHGFIFGTTGAGKSALLNDICAELRHSGVAATFLIDPEDGESMPEWQDHVNWFAWDVDEARNLLLRIEVVMEARRAENRATRWVDEFGQERRGLGQFTPTPERKQLVVIIDESPAVLADPECKRIVGQIGKRGRKVGVSVILVAQVPSLEELGNDQTVRSMASSMNIVAFRTSDRMSSTMGLPKRLPVDPADLPEEWPDGSTTAGLGYLGRGGAAASPFRGLFSKNWTRWATSGSLAELDDVVVEALGEDFLTWRERREAQENGTVFQMPGREAVAEPAAAKGKETCETRILAYLKTRDGAHVTTGALAHAIGDKLTTVQQALKRAEKKRLVWQPGYAMWALGANPNEQLTLDEAAA